MALFNSFLYHPHNYKFESQEDNEKLYFILRRHPITNLGWILGSILMLIIPLITMQLLDGYKINTFKFVPAKYQVLLVAIWYLLSLLYIFEEFLIWYFNVYIITNKRLIDIDFKGFWRKRISEASYDNVEDVTYQTQRFWHVLFDYGDISMQTAAEKSEFEFDSIPKPALVHDTLTNLIEDYKKAHGK